jgi:hypothetical protein
VRVCLALALLSLVGLGAAIPAGATAARPLRLGFLDGLFATGDAPKWLDQAKSDGADIVRLPSSWADLAPTRPTRATEPDDPAYRWSVLDTAVKAASARGLDPLVSLTGAPAWAEGPGRPKSATPGSWRPNPSAFGAFAQALSRRYDGTYPDPAASGAPLPRVAAFQPWNEPNLSSYLAPQWTKSAGGYREASPSMYRALQNAFTRGVHASQPTALSVTAGTAPFGDPQPGGSRIMPARFWRGVLCVSATFKRVSSCGGADFDVLAHHPYSIRGPRGRALNRDDVSVSDMGKLKRILKSAERLGTTPGTHGLWVTEVSWDSKPDDPDGVPERTQAQWLSESFMLLWRQGIDTITWYQMRDQAGPNFAATVQSGTYRANGKPKLSARAFAFPVAIVRRTRNTARVWLRAPAGGTVTLQARRKGQWVNARRLKGVRHGVLEASMTLSGATAVRAVQTGRTSLAAPLR